MTPENRKLFFDHATSAAPREACAVLIVEKGREVLVLCRNKSEVNDQFVIDPRDYAGASKRGEIVAVVHSHCFLPPTPSHADLAGCEASRLRWYICSVPTGAWFEFQPSGWRAPLVGRQWSHGSLDCYGLARDYYLEVLGVHLPDYERQFEWWDKGQNLYEENFRAAGFHEVPLEDLQPHDGLLMQIHSPVINHAGVYLGNDVFLHHLNKRLSSRDVFAGYYRKHTVKIVRYRGGK